nr:unnamed protein product [Callosobruchus chinensis]CAH7725552.1 unnamed protein product [Callosobruchus chinensis]CAH7735246.1 unnamed protein product [Callosobruchus chinensis]CAH7741464.1 unnamed protein product [Callosobruchus chinensis]
MILHSSNLIVIILH